MSYDKCKHLEFIQQVITRMNSNSFLIKGWTVTLVSAIFALAAKDADLNFIIISYISIPVFMGLDAYYLSQERQYRKLYSDVVAETVANYNMDASSYKTEKATWINSLFSKSIIAFYIPLVFITLLVMYFLQANTP